MKRRKKKAGIPEVVAGVKTVTATTPCLLCGISKGAHIETRFCRAFVAPPGYRDSDGTIHGT